MEAMQTRNITVSMQQSINQILTDNHAALMQCIGELFTAMHGQHRIEKYDACLSGKEAKQLPCHHCIPPTWASPDTTFIENETWASSLPDSQLIVQQSPHTTRKPPLQLQPLFGDIEDASDPDLRYAIQKHKQEPANASRPHGELAVSSKQCNEDEEVNDASPSRFLSSSFSIKEVEKHVHSLENGHSPGGLWHRLHKLEEPPRTSKLARAVQSKRFESTLLIVILLNAAYTLYSTNYRMARQTEQKTEFQSLAELLFTTFYCVELVLKLTVHRCYFFCNHDMGWNIADTILVLTSLLDTIYEFVNHAKGGLIDTGFIRFIRIVRLSKTFRMIRLLRYFHELRLMLNCVIGSMMSLFWSFVLLFGVTMVFAIVIIQQLTPYLVERRGTLSDEEYTDISSAFGSVQLGVLSLFKSICGGADWGEYYDMVMPAGPFNCFVFIAYILFVWLSVSNIITSIFVDKAMKLAIPDMEALLLQKHKEDLVDAQELTGLFSSMDINKDNQLTLEELQLGMEHLHVASYFEMKGLDIKDCEMFFKMLSNASGRCAIDIDTFISGCLKMKGFALNIDLLTVQYELRVLAKNICDKIDTYTHTVAKNTASLAQPHFI